MTTDAPIRILAIAGSLREGSFNRLLVRLAASRAPEGVELVEATGLRDVEPFDADIEADGYPAGVAAFAAQVAASDAVFVSTPEYNGSVPGQLKNAFDWLSRVDGGPDRGALRDSPMFGRPAAVVSASDGQFGATWARDEMLKVLRTQGARVVAEPKLALAAAHEAFDADGVLKSPDALERLDGVVVALADTARALRAARAERSASSTGATTT
ncbi:MAG: NAD(P)H-dependent oxidoreductase [Thermoleophilia bacterium]|nr:NAD(P)H-dependent oxidoreductase [Thermoleophilia bacterium]